MKLKNGIGITLALCMLVYLNVNLVSCGFDNEEELFGEVACDTMSLTYNAHIEAIVASSCAITGCHVAGGSAPGIYDNYNGVKAAVDNGSFLQRTTVSDDMPPSGPLSDCNQDLITAWVAAGAPEN